MVDTKSAHAANSPAARVLLVEDNAVNQQVAIAMLEKLGCAVDLASDGQQALAAEARARYDVIFMDCQMPVMDGFATTQVIREREARSGGNDRGARRVPIVAMTANALEGDRERCLTHGMDDYIAKPFRQQQLKVMLERWLPAR
jgi:two-component system, sensor histidine kinase and response regulator